MTPRAEYAPSRPPSAGQGGLVARVEPGSPAALAGITAGSIISAAQGHRLRDLIDWRWYADDATAQIEWEDLSGVTHASVLMREPDEGWGIEFTDAVFDGVRTCRNRCAFCFMEQLPRGLRRALYLRDDDYRLSFLQGNFVTLTNLSDADVERMIEQRLSPLYVSVHSVDPSVRARLVCAQEDTALARFEELLEAGIAFHAQIVLVPDVNDGVDLENTLDWLEAREGVLSVGVVPVGYTRFQSTFVRSYNDPRAAGAVLDQLEVRQLRSRQQTGTTWVYAADEFYLNALRPIPLAEHYDDFPQYENGIGMVRAFLDECGALAPSLADAAAAIRDPARVTVLTGAMAAGTIEAVLVTAGAAGRVEILPVENRFFGGNVGVAGLLTAEDVLEALASRDHSGPYLLPDVVLNSDGLTLDDRTIADLRTASGADVRLVSSDAAGLLAGIASASADTLDPPPRM